MISEKILSILISNEKRKLVSTFFSDSDNISVDEKEDQWHQTHKDSHAKREALLILSGEAPQSLNDRYFQGGANTLFLYDHYETHDRGYWHTAHGMHLWIFMLSDVFICNLLKCDKGNFLFTGRFFFKNMEMIHLIENTWDEAVKSPTDPCIRSQLTVLFNFLFIECYRVFSNPLKIAEASEPSTREQINMIKNYLRDNSGRDSSIDVLAHIAGYSRSHFLRLFRKYANCHVKEYINMIREEKYSRIKDTHPVKSIAWELGFSSTAAFNHWQKGKRKSSPLHRNSAERET